MCGIAGVVAWDEQFRVTREQLQCMSDALAHRGPDGEGHFLNSDQQPIRREAPQCGLAFRRLAIIDPDPRSNQPFTIGPLTLVFNGEIYNFRDLQSEISSLRPDYVWRTQGDAEVLLMSYAVWRERCVEHLNGMYALAVWDDAEKSLYLARDRMGQKPLYVAEASPAPDVRAVAFASEVAALRALPWTSFEPGAWSLTQYLRFGYVGGKSTIYAYVGKLAPATWRAYGRGARTGGTYFNPNEPSAESSGDSVARTRALVTRAVRRQLVADVPLGCFLSGGTDSSVIAAAMKASVERGQRVMTFAIGFDDPRYDETRYAADVARHLGTDHYEFRVHPRAAEDLPRLAEVFGEPFADSSAIPTHYLARETRKHVKVAISGDGGDELFGGYGRYRAMDLARRLEGLVPAFASSSLSRLAAGDPKARATRIGRFFRSLSMPAGRRYASYLRYFDDATIAELLGADVPRDGDDEVARMVEEQIARGLDAARAARATDRLMYLTEDVLTKVDRAGMLHALEVRSPFMDHELVTFTASLTTDQLFKGGPKRLLREAFARDVPAVVFKRPKMGFAIPIGDWFRGELRPMLRDHLFASDSFARQRFHLNVVQRLVDEHESQRVDHAQRLYALLMLELWWRWHRRG